MSGVNVVLDHRLDAEVDALARGRAGAGARRR